MADTVKTQIVPIRVVPTHDVKSPTRASLVLVVDDERLIVDTLVAILDRAGYRTMGAYGGVSGLHLALAHQPDLLITDIFMPDLDGAALALQVTEKVPACRILMISGHASLHDFLSPQKSAFDFRLLSKPIHPSALLREIEETLQPLELHGAGAPHSGGHGHNFA